MTAALIPGRQIIPDPALHARIVACVEKAIATALPGQSETDEDGTDVLWSWREPGDTSAQKALHPGGPSFELSVYWEDDAGVTGPWLSWRTGETGVHWQPGKGFDDPYRFLDWFEART